MDTKLAFIFLVIAENYVSSGIEEPEWVNDMYNIDSANGIQSLKAPIIPPQSSGRAALNAKGGHVKSPTKGHETENMYIEQDGDRTKSSPEVFAVDVPQSYEDIAPHSKNNPVQGGRSLSKNKKSPPNTQWKEAETMYIDQDGSKSSERFGVDVPEDLGYTTQRSPKHGNEAETMYIDHSGSQSSEVFAVDVPEDLSYTTQRSPKHKPDLVIVNSVNFNKNNRPPSKLIVNNGQYRNKARVIMGKSSSRTSKSQNDENEQRISHFEDIRQKFKANYHKPGPVNPIVQLRMANMLVKRNNQQQVIINAYNRLGEINNKKINIFHPDRP